MALCKNPKCMAPLTEYHWGEGYCSKRCMAAALAGDERVSDCLHDPTDPTGHAVICKTADEVDAMLEAYAIDPRLPRIIYMRRKGKSWRDIGKACGLSYMQCDRIFANVTPNLLRACGLRIKA